jgi:hypothetical protein
MLLVWGRYGDGMAMVWRWYGDGMAMVWRWYGDGMAMVWYGAESGISLSKGINMRQEFCSVSLAMYVPTMLSQQRHAT